MPPLPPLAGARGRRLMRIYAAALGYAAGHCHITAVGDPYARLAAGWTGIVTGGLVLLILLWVHARDEQEHAATTESQAIHRAALFIRDLQGRSDTLPQRVIHPD